MDYTEEAITIVARDARSAEFLRAIARLLDTATAGQLDLIWRVARGIIRTTT